MARGEILNILLDTTVLIDILKGDEKGIKKIDELRKTAILYTSTINIYEVLRGMQILDRNKDKHIEALQNLTRQLYVIPFTIEVAHKTSEIYASLKKKGIHIDEADYMIAGCCFSHGIDTIVTRNEKHFGKINGLHVINY